MPAKPDLRKYESFAERQIRAAQEAGDFDRLPGFGKPIPGIDEVDENWWVRRKLREEQLNALPPVLEARLEVERFLETLADISTEACLKTRLRKLAARLEQAHYSSRPGPSVALPVLDAAHIVARWRRLRAARAAE